MKNNYLRIAWILPNVFMYFASFGLIVFISLLYREFDILTFTVYSVFVVLTLFSAVFGTYKILLWIKEERI